MIEPSPDNDELIVSDQPNAPEAPGVWTTKVYPLIFGGMLAIVVGAILTWIISTTFTFFQTDKLEDAFIGGKVITYFAFLISTGVMIISLLIVIPIYRWYGKTLSVPAATIISMVMAVVIVIALLVISGFFFRSNLAMFVVAAIIYGGLSGYFASILEHRALKRRLAKR